MVIFAKSELISLAYINRFDEAELKDEIIFTTISKYIIPVVTPAIYQQAVDDPRAHETLIEAYIKPCLAFYVKYLHLNQLILEGRSFLPSEYQNPKANIKDVAAEVLAIAEQKKLDLSKYIKANYLPDPAPLPTNNKLIGGFLL